MPVATDSTEQCDEGSTKGTGTPWIRRSGPESLLGAIASAVALFEFARPLGRAVSGRVGLLTVVVKKGVQDAHTHVYGGLGLHWVPEPLPDSVV
ncbi:MAG: hypothetical protein LZF60_140074 [Nitrospira sp.]|nr:MAG: hypothetical protein LZF60_140074 [Nitrospira sp.]